MAPPSYSKISRDSRHLPCKYEQLLQIYSQTVLLLIVYKFQKLSVWEGKVNFYVKTGMCVDWTWKYMKRWSLQWMWVFCSSRYFAGNRSTCKEYGDQWAGLHVCRWGLMAPEPGQISTLSAVWIYICAGEYWYCTLMIGLFYASILWGGVWIMENYFTIHWGCALYGAQSDGFGLTQVSWETRRQCESLLTWALHTSVLARKATLCRGCSWLCLGAALGGSLAGPGGRAQLCWTGPSFPQWKSGRHRSVQAGPYHALGGNSLGLKKRPLSATLLSFISDT